MLHFHQFSLGSLFGTRYAIPKIKIICNLHCLKVRLRLPCNKYQRHSSLNLVSQQLKLCNIYQVKNFSMLHFHQFSLGSLFGTRYAIPKIKSICNLHCLKVRLRTLCNKYQRHSSLNLVSQQLKLCNILGSSF